MPGGSAVALRPRQNSQPTEPAKQPRKSLLMRGPVAGSQSERAPARTLAATAPSPSLNPVARGGRRPMNFNTWQRMDDLMARFAALRGGL
jgi:hypothetical protein